jgi:hypothetical protein
MATSYYNLDIQQGSSYSIRFNVKNDDGTYVNLSGYSARGHIKYRYSDATKLLDLNPQIHSSYVSGIVDVNLTAAQTAGLPIIQGIYDIEIFNSGGYVAEVIDGKVFVQPNVTT